MLSAAMCRSRLQNSLLPWPRLTATLLFPSLSHRYLRQMCPLISYISCCQSKASLKCLWLIKMVQAYSPFRIGPFLRRACRTNSSPFVRLWCTSSLKSGHRSGFGNMCRPSQQASALSCTLPRLHRVWSRKDLLMNWYAPRPLPALTACCSRNSRLAAPCRTPFGPAPPSLRRHGHDEGSAALPRRNRHFWPTASVSPDKRITAIKDIAAEFNPSFVPHGRVTSHSSLAREVIRRECAVFASLMVFACLSVL